MVVTSRLSFKKMDTYVKVGGKEVECHAISMDKEKKQLGCWIESSVGKNFSFHLDATFTGPFRTVLWVDGSVVTRTDYLPAPKGTSIVWEYMQTSATTGRYFAFSPLNLTDEDAPIHVRSYVMDKIGTIELEVYDAVSHEIKGVRPRRAEIFQKPQALKIPEVIVKGQAMHQVEFGDEQEIQKLAEKAREAVQRKKAHRNEVKALTAKFTFRYRPRDSLQRSGIVPPDRSTSPRLSAPIDVPTPASRSSASANQQISKKRKASHLNVKEEVKEEEAEIQGQLTADDDDDYTQRERALLAELEKLRNERSVKKENVSRSVGVPRKKVKQEPRSFLTQGEVIDLT